LSLSTLFFPLPQVIAAEGEKSASMALRDAALTIAQSPAALQLRYLQTLNTISAERNSTIVFPFPVDFFSAMLGNRQQPPQQQQSYQPIPGVSVPNESSNEASSTFLHTARVGFPNIFEVKAASINSSHIFRPILANKKRRQAMCGTDEEEGRK
jgi:hypothetical protein